jgi:hypothetical protein
MAGCRTIDALRWAHEFHKSLSEYYENLSHEVHNKEAQRLLSFLGRHETFLNHCVEEYEQGGSADLLETWFKVTPEFPTMESLAEIVVSPDITAPEIIDLMIQMDALLFRLYEQLAREAISPRLREALDNLLALEKREEIRAISSAQPM